MLASRKSHFEVTSIFHDQSTCELDALRHTNAQIEATYDHFHAIHADMKKQICTVVSTNYIIIVQADFLILCFNYYHSFSRFHSVESTN